MSALEQDDPVFALAEEQRQLSDRLEQVRQTVVDLAEAQSALAGDLGSVIPKHQAPWWPRLSRQERQDQWAQVVYWIAGVLLPRQPALRRILAGTRSSPAEGCWHRHPDVVDELTVLYATWRTAYEDPNASVLYAAEWFDRWVPGARRRIEESLKECRRSHISDIDKWAVEDVDPKRWADVMPPDMSLES